jgi:hypothetical protein
MSDEGLNVDAIISDRGFQASTQLDVRGSDPTAAPRTESGRRDSEQGGYFMFSQQICWRLWRCVHEWGYRL